MAASPVHYIPIATTIMAAFFSTVVLRRYSVKGGTHLLWWGIGMVTYGIGTLTESLTTLLAWQEPVFRAWYITGALLGGAPLAQGSVYLLMKRRTANLLTVALVTAVIVASVSAVRFRTVPEKRGKYAVTSSSRLAPCFPASAEPRLDLSTAL